MTSKGRIAQYVQGDARMLDRLSAEQDQVRRAKAALLEPQDPEMLTSDRWSRVRLVSTALREAFPDVDKNKSAEVTRQRRRYDDPTLQIAIRLEERLTRTVGSDGTEDELDEFKELLAKEVTRMVGRAKAAMDDGSSSPEGAPLDVRDLAELCAGQGKNSSGAPDERWRERRRQLRAALASEPLCDEKPQQATLTYAARQARLRRSFQLEQYSGRGRPRASARASEMERLARKLQKEQLAHAKLEHNQWVRGERIGRRHEKAITNEQDHLDQMQEQVEAVGLLAAGHPTRAEEFHEWRPTAREKADPRGGLTMAAKERLGRLVDQLRSIRDPLKPSPLSRPLDANLQVSAHQARAP